MDLLIKHAAETDGIQSYAPLLWPLVWSNMERTAGVAIRMTIKAGHAQAGLLALPVVGRVELLLGERRHQQAQSVELRYIERAPIAAAACNLSHAQSISNLQG